MKVILSFLLSFMQGLVSFNPKSFFHLFNSIGILFFRIIFYVFSFRLPYKMKTILLYILQELSMFLFFLPYVIYYYFFKISLYVIFFILKILILFILGIFEYFNYFFQFKKMHIFFTYIISM
jgi:hypothetical protein